MPNSISIPCPYCSKIISVDDALTHQLEDKYKKQLAAETEKIQDELVKQQREMEKQVAELEKSRLGMEKELQTKLASERQKLLSEAKAQVSEQMSSELKDMHTQKQEMLKKLETAQENELAFRKKARELEEQKKDLDLELERKLENERKKIEEQLVERQQGQLEERLKSIQEDFRRKELEKDKQLDQLKRSLDEAQRKSEQASMQIQGDAQEDDLKAFIKLSWPLDEVLDVPTGINGADLVQRVRSPLGLDAGVVLWESKNTKVWDDKWIKKLKDDQAIAKADICILVTKTLPNESVGFSCINGVWVTNYTNIAPLVSTLRFHLLELAKVKTTMVGKDEKMQYLYDYLTGNQFRNKIENIVMAFSSMKQDLESEKRALQKIWSKRDKEIERVILNTSGLYGDLQGIVGTSLPTIEHLELEVEKPEQLETPSLF